MKRKNGRYGCRGRGKQKMMSASAPSRLTASTAIKRPVIDMTIQVRDKYAAVREIEALLSQFNARIVGRQHREESEFLKAEIAAQNIAAFMDRLEAIGRVSMETRPLAVSDGNVTVSMKIVRNP